MRYLVHFLAVLAVPLLERAHTQNKEYRSTFGTIGTAKNECKRLTFNALNSVPLLERSTTLIFSGMNPLDVPISFFSDCKDVENPDNRGTFRQVVTSKKLAAKYAPLLEKIRATNDPDEKKALKKRCCAVSVSGTFSRRSDDALLQHSGLMAFDIDADNNPGLNEKTAASLRDKIALFPQVLFCSRSVSFRGVWGVVAIKNPELHTEHFAALKADFAGWGVSIDAGCGDLSRLRFLPFDPGAIIKSEGTIYTKLLFPKVHQPKPWTGSAARPDDLAMQAAKFLIDTRATVAFGYDDYFKIVTACKNAFGDNGELIAWNILENCPCFAVSNFRKDFASKWKSAGSKVTGGTLVHIARQAGFRYSSDATTTAPQVAPRSTQAPTPGKIIETFVSQSTGQAFELTMTADGYPAIFDEPAPPTPSPLQQAAAILAGFDWQAGKVEPIHDLEAEQSEYDNSPGRLNALAIMRRGATYITPPQRAKQRATSITTTKHKHKHNEQQHN